MITRDPQTAADSSYDLIIVGGGSLGISMALEAARRQLRPLLIERADFGGATSWNSQRIIHGGLRYLQSLQLFRHRRSVTERSWLLRNFPDLVEPLPCLMPLHGEGIYRTSVFRVAFRADRILSGDPNAGLEAASRLQPGRVLSKEETLEWYPGVARRGLRGGALWFDATVPDSQRLLIEMLHWATKAGAVALNYVSATDLLVRNRRVEGIGASDRVSGDRLEYRAPLVVNCAGPWCRDVAKSLDRDIPHLFHPALAFALLLDRPPLSRAAVAVRSRKPDKQTYFLSPWKTKLLVGTRHEPWSPGSSEPGNQRQLWLRLLESLNQTVTAGDFSETDILRVFWGRLPAVEDGSSTPIGHSMLCEHAALGGPAGLFSVRSIKLTTARSLAERVLRRTCASRGEQLPEVAAPQRPVPQSWLPAPEFASLLETDTVAALALVSRIASHEAVVHLEDLMLRRTDWGILPSYSAALEKRLSSTLEFSTANRPSLEGEDA